VRVLLLLGGATFRLLSRRFQVSDQVGALVLLLQTGKDHLGSWDVLLGVGEVDFQRVFIPVHALLDVGLRVGETGGLAGLSAPESPQVGASLVFASFFDGVALSATLDEDLFALVNVSTSHFSCWPSMCDESSARSGLYLTEIWMLFATATLK